MRLTEVLFFSKFIIDDTPIEKNSTSETNVIKLVDPWFIQSLSREHRVEAKIVLNDHVEDIFVKIVAYKP